MQSIAEPSSVTRSLLSIHCLCCLSFFNFVVSFAVYGTPPGSCSAAKAPSSHKNIEKYFYVFINTCVARGKTRTVPNTPPQCDHNASPLSPLYTLYIYSYIHAERTWFMWSVLSSNNPSPSSSICEFNMQTAARTFSAC